jgi:hypothetical protein
MVAPPFVIGEDGIAELYEKIESTLAEMEKKFG